MGHLFRALNPSVVAKLRARLWSQLNSYGWDVSDVSYTFLGGRLWPSSPEGKSLAHSLTQKSHWNNPKCTQPHQRCAPSGRAETEEVMKSFGLILGQSTSGASSTSPQWTAEFFRLWLGCEIVTPDWLIGDQQVEYQPVTVGFGIWSVLPGWLSPL